MKLIYLDCHSGISGDMLLAALIDAGADHDVIQSSIDSLGVDDVRMHRTDVIRHGFRALKIDIAHPPQHAHRHLSDIVKMIERSDLSLPQQDSAKRIFHHLATAEAKVHGSSLEKVHFHEVGAIDSIADIVGVAVALDLLDVDQVHSSPVPTGTGTIQIAHGEVSVPAPATAELLKGVPIVASDIDAELTTPTGAAFLGTLVDSFGPLPSMTVQSIGYGAGSRDLSHQANILRVLVGESTAESSDTTYQIDQVVQLETNLDDASGEQIGHAVTMLDRAGALDVCLIAVHMKKNRPGVILSLLCRPEDTEALKSILFLETGTLGVREQSFRRTTLQRRQITVETLLGSIQGKVFRLPDGKTRFSPEYESANQIACHKRLPLDEVYISAQMAFEQIPKHNRWPDA